MQSTGLGDAGSVELTAGGLIAIDGANVESSSIGDNVGLAGSVTILGGDLSLTGDAKVSTNTTSNQFAVVPGTITLISDSGVLLDSSNIETETSGAAEAPSGMPSPRSIASVRAQ